MTVDSQGSRPRRLLGVDLQRRLATEGMTAAEFADHFGLKENTVVEWSGPTRKIQQLPRQIAEALKKEQGMTTRPEKTPQNVPLLDTENLDEVREKLMEAGSVNRANGIHLAFIVPAAGGMIYRDQALDAKLKSALAVFSDDATFIDRLHSYFNMMLTLQRQRSAERGDFELFVFVFSRWVVTVTPFGRGEHFTEALVTLSLNKEVFPLNIVSEGVRTLVDQIRSIK